MNILITTKLPREGFTEMANHYVIMPEKHKFTPEEFLALIPETDFIISTFDYKITREMIMAGTNLKAIINFGVGFNNVDLKAAGERNLIVTNTPLPVIEPTAEHAFTLMLAISHRVAELDRRMRMPDSDIEFGVMMNLGVAIYGKTLGIIGMGNIGKSVARRASACGMKILYNKRHRLTPEEEKEYNATFVEVDELLRNSDYVSLHCPYTPETHHIIDDQAFLKMKDGAILINTARGACVDEAALVRALQSRKLFGAGLDVYEFEPKLTPELYTLDNVVLSPHIGTGTIDARIEMCHNCCRNIQYFLDGKYEKMDRVN
ncbi:MAG: NAD(P)-binding domain-containing protein [Paludibacteraceae bacterium]|nr:NAD(P)-binding domain-containing protein [Paludibacteraceae bacterium]